METEKKKLYVNTKASGMVKFIRVMAWVLAIGGVIAGSILCGSAEEEAGVPTLVSGFVFFLIAVFIKPAYVRTLAAEIEIARAKEDYILCSDEALTKEIKA